MALQAFRGRRLRLPDAFFHVVVGKVEACAEEPGGTDLQVTVSLPCHDCKKDADGNSP